MNVYTCNQFTGYWPVGTAAVVVAESQGQAAQILNEQLKTNGLPGDATTSMMLLVEQEAPRVIILRDGNY